MDYEPDIFWSRVTRGNPEDCWPWTGAIDEGYGAVRAPDSGRTEHAHRVAFRLVGGVIPRGYDVDHVCVNGVCCNPDHLQAITRSDNSRLVVMRREHLRGVTVVRRRMKDGWSWQVRWREDGRQRSETFPREVEARQRARVVHVLREYS